MVRNCAPENLEVRVRRFASPRNEVTKQQKTRRHSRRRVFWTRSQRWRPFWTQDFPDL
jgi:hypothetical protein